ncbi:hypothetical protein AVEN_60083-1 [Araneus ventricosus]|uniref:Uncharacterized protein n=1 Tax=Araneus ventricosus TaxID=182803 RepID=A0A4Y2HY69_ARAVE|nr:hypothetical protein AVEN_60083-1 [Araneus ventricosus]
MNLLFKEQRSTGPLKLPSCSHWLQAQECLLVDLFITPMIPKDSYRTVSSLQRYLLNDSYNDALLFEKYEYTSKVRTFVEYVEDFGWFLKCYSDNLHLYRSRSKLKTKKLIESRLTEMVETGPPSMNRKFRMKEST